MSATFDQYKFKYTTLAATLILSGVVFKNSYEQLGEPEHFLSTTAGPAAFVGGWALLAYALSMNAQQKFEYKQPYDLRFFACAIAIVGTVFWIKMKKKEKQDPGMIKYLFVIGWLALGYFMPDRNLGLFAAALVIASMVMVLPWQRKHAVVDGFGMPMFTAAWGIIIYIASHVAPAAAPSAAPLSLF